MKPYSPKGILLSLWLVNLLCVVLHKAEDDDDFFDDSFHDDFQVLSNSIINLKGIY